LILTLWQTYGLLVIIGVFLCFDVPGLQPELINIIELFTASFFTLSKIVI